MQILSDDLARELTGQGHQHPPLVPALLQGRQALPPGACPRGEAHRRHRPLRHRRISTRDRSSNRKSSGWTTAAPPNSSSQMGRDVEGRTLAQAVQWHAEHRVLLDGNRRGLQLSSSRACPGCRRNDWSYPDIAPGQGRAGVVRHPAQGRGPARRAGVAAARALDGLQFVRPASITPAWTCPKRTSGSPAPRAWTSGGSARACPSRTRVLLRLDQSTLLHGPATEHGRRPAGTGARGGTRGAHRRRLSSQVGDGEACRDGAQPGHFLLLLAPA